MTYMVPGEIETAKMADGLPDDIAGEIVAAQIAGQRDGTAARPGDLMCNRFRRIFVQIDHGNRGALAGKGNGAGLAHAGTGSGNQANLVRLTHSGCLLQTSLSCWSSQPSMMPLNTPGCSTFGKCRARAISA